MPLIVLDGLDGSGGSTQTNLLKKFFEKKNIPYLFVKSPEYGTETGHSIRDYLDGKIKLKPKQAFVLFATDVLNSVPIIKKGLEENKVVIADRYITSTIAYQCANGYSFESALNFVKLHEYPEADLIIFIDIKPETSMKRKLKEHGRLDRHEKDLNFLRKVREFYSKEIKGNILGRWVVVDGEKSIEEVHKDIINSIKPLYQE
ncbi:MAG: dTMP kinase [Candidatus Aenigmarchaeota archaeon]|nr:dTMP kinase [Candidatus Aenigmarchaeota archaeon]